jgi:hypothetical protein
VGDEPHRPAVRPGGGAAGPRVPGDGGLGRGVQEGPRLALVPGGVPLAHDRAVDVVRGRVPARARRPPAPRRPPRAARPAASAWPWATARGAAGGPRPGQAGARAPTGSRRRRRPPGRVGPHPADQAGAPPFRRWYSGSGLVSHSFPWPAARSGPGAAGPGGRAQGASRGRPPRRPTPPPRRQASSASPTRGAGVVRRPFVPERHQRGAHLGAEDRRPPAPGMGLQPRQSPGGEGVQPAPDGVGVQAQPPGARPP